MADRQLASPNMSTIPFPSQLIELRELVLGPDRRVCRSYKLCMGKKLKGRRFEIKYPVKIVIMAPISSRLEITGSGHLVY
jgi:hypothetical protein